MRMRYSELLRARRRAGRDLPSAAINGLELSGSVGAASIYLVVLTLLIAVAAIVLAPRERLVPAIALVVLPRSSAS